jgi:hypothetical protein
LTPKSWMKKSDKMSNCKPLAKMQYTSQPWDGDRGITILQTNDHDQGCHIALVPKDIQLSRPIYFCADFDKKKIEQEVFLENAASLKIEVLYSVPDQTSAFELLHNLIRSRTSEIVEVN